MNDRMLRELRRRAVAGDPQAEAAWLRARVRAGELQPEQLRLAAYLGSAPAARALDQPPRLPGELRGWVRGLGRFSKEACVRAAVAAAELVVRPEEQHTLQGRALAAARQWIDCPCRSCAADAEEALGDRRVNLTRRERAALEAARAAAGVVCPPQEPQYRGVYSAPRRARKAARCAAVKLGDDAVAEAIQRALIPWALGLPEPVTSEQQVGVVRPRPTPDRWSAAWSASRARARGSEAPSAAVEPSCPSNAPVENPEGLFWALVAVAAALYSLLRVVG